MYGERLGIENGMSERGDWIGWLGVVLFVIGMVLYGLGY